MNKLNETNTALELEIQKSQTNNDLTRAQTLQQSLEKNQAKLLSLEQQANKANYQALIEDTFCSEIVNSFFTSFKESISKYLEHGKQPDGMVTLPLIDPSIQNDALGMNLEEILKKCTKQLLIKYHMVCIQKIVLPQP